MNMELRSKLRVIARRSNGEVNHRPTPRSATHLELQKLLVVPVTEECSLFDLNSISVLDNFRYYGIIHGISLASAHHLKFMLWREQFPGEKECGREVANGIVVPASSFIFTREVVVAWKGRKAIFINFSLAKDAQDAIRLFASKPSSSFVEVVDVLRRLAA